MATETQEDENRIDENELFSSNLNDEQEADDDLAQKLFRGDSEGSEDTEDAEEEEENEEEEEKAETLKFGEEEEEEDEITDEELKSFNKKLDTDFKTAQELKDFLKKDAVDPKDAKAEEDEYQTASDTVDQFTAIVKLDDEPLMRRQFETIAIQKGKDINDEEVAAEIEDQVQDLIDSRTISLHAKNLRDEINNKLISPALNKKTSIDNQRAEAKAAAEKTDREVLESTLAEIFQKDYFGVKTEKKVLSQVYKDVSSGEFLRKLGSDKKAQAELAVLLAYKPQVYKKATGLTFSDGLKAATEDFDSKSKDSGSPMTKAQKRGTSGGSDGSKGLLGSLLSDKEPGK